MSALESKLRRMSSTLDEAALEALASKGLLRRARKDLERSVQTGILRETQTILYLQVGEYEITLPETGPATAACSCPSAGVCQHILTALLFLRQPDPASESSSETLPGASTGNKADPPEQEIMAITPSQLEQWAGKAAFKAGMILAGSCIPDISGDHAIRLRFAAFNADVLFVPGGGLDGMIVSGRKGGESQCVVAAVIAFQRASGIEWAIPADAGALEASEGAPRNRSQILDSCEALFRETLAGGLSRLSDSTRQRWATLAVSALGVNLPRLALALRGIADEASLALARDARSDLARMLARMAEAHALCAALRKDANSPRPDLVGLHRTRYDDVGHLDLAGVAAWPWRTASGYEGLTVLFWDMSARHWTSWSEARPRHQQADFAPAACYIQPGPWDGADSPRQLARSRFRLMNARRNPGYRLSGSTKSRALVTGSCRVQELNLPIVEDWTLLARQLNAQSAIGLKESNPLHSIFALKPAAWGGRDFDSATQVLTWIIDDAARNPLLMEIGFDDFTESAIKFLESAQMSSLEGATVIGRIQQTPRGLSMLPYSIHLQNGRIIHLCLDTVELTHNKPRASMRQEEDFLAGEDDSESTMAPSPAMGRLLDELDDTLLALAEAGFASLNPLRVERLSQMTARIERLGLHALAVVLRQATSNPQSLAILRCFYLSQMHRRASSVGPA